MKYIKLYENKEIEEISNKEYNSEITKSELPNNIKEYIISKLGDKYKIGQIDNYKIYYIKYNSYLILYFYSNDDYFYVDNNYKYGRYHIHEDHYYKCDQLSSFIKFIKNHHINESIQQSEKLLKDNSIESKDFNKLNQKLIENGLQSYAGYITKLIINSNITGRYDFDDAHINLIIRIFKDIKLYNINIEKEFPIKEISKQILYTTVTISSIKHFIDEYKDYTLVKKFILRYIPSQLRSEINSLPRKKISDFYIYKDKITNLDIDCINNIKQLSYIKNLEEWLDFVYDMLSETSKYSLNELKEHNIVIYYEDNEYLIYKPIDFKAYKVINYNFWCTKIQNLFNDYSKKNMVIYLNKKNIKESYMSYNDTVTKKTTFYDFRNIKSSYNEVINKVGNGINNISIKF